MTRSSGADALNQRLVREFKDQQHVKHAGEAGAAGYNILTVGPIPIHVLGSYERLNFSPLFHFLEKYAREVSLARSWAVRHRQLTRAFGVQFCTKSGVFLSR